MREQSEPIAYVTLLTSNQRQLYRYILTFLPRASDAEEVLQETNVVLWVKAAEFDSTKPFLAWAYKVAYFEVLAFRKRQARERLTFSPELTEIFAAEAGGLESNRDRRRSVLDSCLEKLSQRDRDLVVRRYAPGTTPQQLATAMSRPASSIYRSLERIRSILLTCIQQTISAEEHP
jgi:RNA polymerase sigma-70 factor (ECF subfamily)